MLVIMDSGTKTFIMDGEAERDKTFSYTRREGVTPMVLYRRALSPFVYILFTESLSSVYRKINIFEHLIIF